MVAPFTPGLSKFPVRRLPRPSVLDVPPPSSMSGATVFSPDELEDAVLCLSFCLRRIIGGLSNDAIFLVLMGAERRGRQVGLVGDFRELIAKSFACCNALQVVRQAKVKGTELARKKDFDSVAAADIELAGFQPMIEELAAGLVLLGKALAREVLSEDVWFLARMGMVRDAAESGVPEERAKGLTDRAFNCIEKTRKSNPLHEMF